MTPRTPRYVCQPLVFFARTLVGDVTWCVCVQAWFEFFVYMDGLRAEEGASPDIQDLCIRVCGSLLHPSRRQVLMPIWDSRIQVTPTDLLNRIEVALATIHQRNLQPSVLPSTTSV